MSDKAPLLFKARLGGLFPANTAAEAAMRETQGTVTVSMTGGKANQRRRGLYWATLALVTPLINERHQMTLSDDDLHAIMRSKCGLFDEVTLPSGEVHRRLHSTSNRAMGEAERAAYTDKCLTIWSTWLGIDVATLRHEAEALAA